MGDDAGDRQVQRQCDVDQRLAVFEDGPHELLGEVAVRAAVTARCTLGRQGRTGQFRQLLFHAGICSAPHRSPLPADPAGLGARSLRVPAYGHPRHTPLAGPQQGNLRAEGVLVAVVLRLQLRDDAAHTAIRSLVKRYT